MAKKKLDPIRMICNDCRREMEHRVHADVHKLDEAFSDTGGYHTFDFHHQLVECVGCHNFAYRYVDVDHDSREETITAFPDRWKHYPPDWMDSLHQDTYDVLTQVYKTIANGSNTLALIGMRLTLDIVTYRLLPTVHYIDSRIDELCKQPNGPFKDSDKEFLRVVKNAGDGAAHRGLSLNDRLTIRLVKVLEHILHRIEIEPIEAAERERTTKTISGMVPPDPRKIKPKPTNHP